MNNYSINLYVIFYNIFIQLSLWHFSKLMINFRSNRQYSLHTLFQSSDVILHSFVFQPSSLCSSPSLLLSQLLRLTHR